MLKKLTDLPAGIMGVMASGVVTKHDYETVLEPLLDEARREGHRVKILFQFGPGLERFTAGAAWEDARVGLGSLRLFEGCAIVSDVGWVPPSIRGSSLTVQLHGLVAHAREFPGWEGLGSLLGHIRFIRDHHHEIKRVALASDSKLATLAPRIAEHFVAAKVHGFGHHELERAIEWAGEPSA